MVLKKLHIILNDITQRTKTHFSKEKKQLNCTNRYSKKKKYFIEQNERICLTHAHFPDVVGVW